MQLSSKEAEIIAKHLKFYQDLEFGRIKPTSVGQSRFIWVTKGLLPPETEHEIAYLKFTNRLPAKTGDAVENPNFQRLSKNTPSCVRCERALPENHPNSICDRCIENCRNSNPDFDRFSSTRAIASQILSEHERQAKE